MLNPETPREVQLLKEYQHYISLSYQYSKQISAMEDEIESLKDRIEKLEDIIVRASRMAESEQAGMVQQVLSET